MALEKILKMPLKNLVKIGLLMKEQLMINSTTLLKNHILIRILKM